MTRAKHIKRPIDILRGEKALVSVDQDPDTKQYWNNVDPLLKFWLIDGGVQMIVDAGALRGWERLGLNNGTYDFDPFKRHLESRRGKCESNHSRASFEKALDDIQKAAQRWVTYVEGYPDDSTEASIKEAIHTVYPELNELAPPPYDEIN